MNWSIVYYRDKDKNKLVRKKVPLHEVEQMFSNIGGRPPRITPVARLLLRIDSEADGPPEDSGRKQSD